MNSTIGLISCFYVLVSLVCLFTGCMNLSSLNWKDKRMGARLLIFSPVWPIAAAWVVATNIGPWVKELCRIADLGRKQ